MNLHIKIPNHLLTTLAAIIVVAVLHTPCAGALTGNDFQAGRIIDDGVFTNTSSMSVQDINNFLAAKVPTCDTNGTQLTTHSNGSGGYYTRAQWGSVYDSTYNTTIAAAPYVCLKDYRENPNTHQNNLQNPGANIPGAVSAGEIIYYAALAYHINPEVLLVTLQKEQGLVTDDWPWTNEYSAAMGYACPDDGTGCHSTYAGFAVQVNNAAWQFRDYLNNPTNYNYTTGSQPIRNNTIDSGCTSSPVINIQNLSTAALYDYTPYQPDQDVLTNTNPTGSSSGPGQVSDGDACATYGNRNFWWYFNSWFGSTLAINGSIQLVSGLQVTPSSSTLYVNDTVTASYQVKNTASFDINAGSLGICARLNGQWYDFGFANDRIVPANGSINVSYSKKLTTPGSLNVYMCSYNPAFGWASSSYPYDINGGLSRESNIIVGDSPIITSGIELGPYMPGIDEAVDAYVSVKNSSLSDINVGSLVVAARDPNGNNVDFPIKNDVIIPANSTQILKWSRIFTVPGSYSFYLAHWNGSWDTNYPHSANNAVIRQLNWPILDNPLISSGITISTPNPTTGAPVDAVVTFRNTSNADVDLHSLVIAARDSSGRNLDFPIKNDVIIPANSTTPVTWSQTFATPGTYNLFIAHWWNTWDTSYPKSMDGSIIRQVSLKVN